jgi:hypothetical protein
MKLIRNFYHFLGSIQFAITLIGTVAIFVIAGTFIESNTESHRYASQLTYGNPIFSLLLWCFFLNILVSALRRWPFKMRHIPFLITHFGLLLILGGALVKNYFGTQGSMSILEGTGKEEVFIADTYAIQLQKRDPSDPENILTKNYDLKRNIWGNLFLSSEKDSKNFEELDLQLLEYAPHSREKFEGWIKNDKLHISGLPPIPLQTPSSHLAISAKWQLPGSLKTWDVIALKGENIEEMIHSAYTQQTEIVLKDPSSSSILFQGFLDNAIAFGIPLNEGHFNPEVKLNFSNFSGLINPTIQVVKDSDSLQETMSIPLDGCLACQNINQTFPFLGIFPVSIDLVQNPSLIFLKNDTENVFLFSLDGHGRIHNEIFRMDNLPSLISYDEGFGGYALQSKIPHDEESRENLEKTDRSALTRDLRKYFETTQRLPLPLQLLFNASGKTQLDFAAATVDFLYFWNNNPGWILPKNAVLPKSLEILMQNIDWNSINETEKKGCYWTCKFFDQFEQNLKKNPDPLAILKELGWPMNEYLTSIKTSEGSWKPEEVDFLLTTITQQLFSVAPFITELPTEIPNQRLISAYLRFYSFHLHNLITKTAEQKPLKPSYLLAETPLRTSFQKEVPLKKLEENIPVITLKISKGKKNEIIRLGYDRFGTKFKWPIFNGEYRIRFQPKFQKLPYRIRLRDARQLNYSNSTQPYSYESDLIITDLKKKSSEEKMISMNNVHETWDGYRFYLANISPPNETSVQRVQIVVNHDPGKYYFTYPGAIILTCGIFLLFWFRKRR